MCNAAHTVAIITYRTDCTGNMCSMVVPILIIWCIWHWIIIIIPIIITGKIVPMLCIPLPHIICQITMGIIDACIEYSNNHIFITLLYLPRLINVHISIFCTTLIINILSCIFNSPQFTIVGIITLKREVCIILLYTLYCCFHKRIHLYHRLNLFKAFPWDNYMHPVNNAKFFMFHAGPKEILHRLYHLRSH